MMRLLTTLVVMAWGATLYAQVTIVEGQVTDSQTGETIAFANIIFAGTTIGTTTDFNGYYSIETAKLSDSLTCSFIGYKPQTVKVKRNTKQTINFKLEVNTALTGTVVIEAGENPAHAIFRKIIENKKDNNKSNLESYSYEAYNKLQFDLNNFDKKISEIKLLNSINFIFEDVDTSESGKPYLPVFITETVSDYYYQRNPSQKKEWIKASKVSGLKNASFSQFMGDMYQNLDIYENTIILFDRNFISPIANTGLLFYKYYLTDSATIDGLWCKKLEFMPRFKQDLAFTGHFWVHDTTFAIKSIQLQINKDANINFIQDFYIKHEYTRVDGKHWMRSKESIVADFNPLKIGTAGIYGRKTTTYRNFSINKSIDDKYFAGAVNIQVLDSALTATNSYWAAARPDSLTKAEKTIYRNADTLQTIPLVKRSIDAIYTISTGYVKVGYLEFGSVFSILGFNQLQGQRIRLGIRTSNKFSKRIELNAYSAFGVRSNDINYGFKTRWMITKKPRRLLIVSYKKDIELLGQNSFFSSGLNFVATVARRNPLNQIMKSRVASLSYEREWFSGFSNTIFLSHRQYLPNQFMPFNQNGQNISNLTVAEATLVTYFAYDEKYVSGEFDRISLGTRYPRITLTTTAGFAGLWGSQYNYQNVKLYVDDRIRFVPLGYLDYVIDAGYLFGRVPYPLLNIQTGNETYALSYSQLNMANFYEFVTDRYIKFFGSYHMDGLLLNKIPLLRKLKWREVASFKAVYGGLRKENYNYWEFPDGMFALNNAVYAEASVGIDNIFKVFRVDCFWRLTQLNNPNIPIVGVRGLLTVKF